MADIASIKLRNFKAQQRMDAICPRLAEALGVSPPATPELLTDDPQYRAMQRLESVTDWLEAVYAAQMDAELPQLNRRK